MKEDELILTYDTNTFNSFIKFGIETLAQREQVFPMNSDIEIESIVYDEGGQRWIVNAVYDEFSVN